MVACCVLTAGMGVWALTGVRSFLDGGVTTWGLIAAIALLGWGLFVLWLVVRPRSPIYGLSDRLFAGPAGVRTGAGARNSYPWSQIAGFETLLPRRAATRWPRWCCLTVDGSRCERCAQSTMAWAR